MASVNASQIFALIIGVNKYRSHKISRLEGCVNDATRFRDYLSTTLGVPNKNVKLLTDEGATRAAILESFDTHLLENIAINKDNNPTLIFYFAGHGGRVTAPDKWLTRDRKIETICPVDYLPLTTSKDNDQPIFTGISDITLNVKLRLLAEEKGDNIIVIFDCCHAAGATRNPDGGICRGVDDYEGPVQFPDDETKLWGAVVDQHASRAKSSGFRGCDRSHVLLAASTQDESAKELKDSSGEYSGVFTDALLYWLRRYNQTSLTYFELMASVRRSVAERVHKQSPTCYSLNGDRWLFGREACSRFHLEPAFILEEGPQYCVTRDQKFGIEGQEGISHRLEVHLLASEKNLPVLKFHCPRRSKQMFCDIDKHRVTRIRDFSQNPSPTSSVTEVHSRRDITVQAIAGAWWWWKVPDFVQVCIRQWFPDWLRLRARPTDPSTPLMSRSAGLGSAQHSIDNDPSILEENHSADASVPPSAGCAKTAMIDTPIPVKFAFIVKVGKSDGVYKSSQFVLPFQVDDNPPKNLNLKVDRIEQEGSILVLNDEDSELYHQLPSKAEATWRVQAEHLLRVYLKQVDLGLDSPDLKLPQNHDFMVVKDRDRADVEISYDKEKHLLKVKRLDQLFLQLAKASGSDIDEVSIQVPNSDDIPSTLDRIAHFHYHLLRSFSSSQNPRITKLGVPKEITFQIPRLTRNERGHRVPESEEDHPSQPPDTRYGIKISNNQQGNLYLSLFCFDPSNYEIKLYAQSIDKNDSLLGIGHKGSINACGRNEFSVGYGPGGGDPIKFNKGECVFFKLFASGKWFDLKFVECQAVGSRPETVPDPNDVNFEDAWVVGVVVKDQPVVLNKLDGR